MSPDEAAVKGSATTRSGRHLPKTAGSCTVSGSTHSERPRVAKPLRTKPVTAGQVRAYATKAGVCRGRGPAISKPAETSPPRASPSTRASTPPMPWARLGKRSAGEDHDHVLLLLRDAGPTAPRSSGSYGAFSR